MACPTLAYEGHERSQQIVSTYRTHPPRTHHLGHIVVKVSRCLSLAALIHSQLAGSVGELERKLLGAALLAWYGNIKQAEPRPLRQKWLCQWRGERGGRSEELEVMRVASLTRACTIDVRLVDGPRVDCNAGLEGLLVLGLLQLPSNGGVDTVVV